MNGIRSDRFLSVMVGALVSYAFLETFIAYARERREQFTAWRDKFVEPFVRHPGRREWLRDTLVREEMNVKAPVADDCGCDDAG